MKIARCTPSRGLIHSRTEEAAETVRLWASAAGYQWYNLYTNDLPIPDCFNVVCERALAVEADLIWMLEEDIAPAEAWATFRNMLEAIEQGADYVTAVYPIGKLEEGNRNQNPVTFDGAGRMVWCTMGCLLLTRKCFDLMPRPWFTLRNRLIKAGVVTWDEGADSPYGCDIGFTFGLYHLELKGVLIKDEIRHLRVREYGQARKNNGIHVIEALKWGSRRYDDGSFDGRKWCRESRRNHRYQHRERSELVAE